MSSATRRLLGVLISLAVLVTGCQPYHSTPESVFQAMKDARAAGDYRAATVCLNERSQQLLAGSLVMAANLNVAARGMGAKFGLANGEDADKLKEILQRHGVGEGTQGPQLTPEGISQLAEGISDKPGFVAEVMAVLAAEKDSPKGLPMGPAAGELTEVTIDGDHARGTVKSGGFPIPIHFENTGMGWRIDLMGQRR